MMFDQMNLSCPCCVCLECAKLDVHAWPEPSELESVGQTKKTGIYVPLRTGSPRSVVKTGSISDLHQSDFSLSSTSSRSLRLSMDGSINEHEVNDQSEIVPSSPRRPVRRVASVSVSQTNYDFNTSDESLESKPKSLSRLPSRSPRAPRMQRRCSVTKFSLDDALQQVQLDDKQDTTVLPALTPCIEESEVQVRHRIRRRCSVTKYNLDKLEDALFNVQQEEATNDLSQRSPQTTPIPPCRKELESFPGLIATPESKRNFKAKLPWGRAA